LDCLAHHSAFCAGLAEVRSHRPPQLAVSSFPLSLSVFLKQNGLSARGI
jgi:hypothetical protein